MSEISNTELSLRIIGANLVPSEVSSILGCEPTHEKTNGQPYSYTKTGKPKIAKFGMWFLKVANREPGDLDAQITELLSLLSDDLNAWRVLSKAYEIDLFCGLFLENEMEGGALSSETLLNIGQRGIDLSLDIYGQIENRAQT